MMSAAYLCNGPQSGLIASIVVVGGLSEAAAGSGAAGFDRMEGSAGAIRDLFLGAA